MRRLKNGHLTVLQVLAYAISKERKNSKGNVVDDIFDAWSVVVLLVCLSAGSGFSLSELFCFCECRDLGAKVNAST
jgi:hypothetical protein